MQNLPAHLQAAYARDPSRQRIAQALATGASGAPVQSHMQGLTRALTGGVGQLQQNKLDANYAAQGDQYSGALAQALAAQTPEARNAAIQGMGSGGYGLQEALLEQQMLAQEKMNKPMSVAAGASLVNPNTGEVIFKGSPKPGKRSDLSRTLLEAGVLEGSPQWEQAHADRAKKLTSNSPLTKVVMPGQEKAWDKQRGKDLAKSYQDILDGSRGARLSSAKLKRLDQLLDQVETGTLSPTSQKAKRLIASAGFDFDALGLTADMGPAEAAEALANEMALELRNPAGGAGMPGAMSDKDREFLVSMIPSLSQTKEGRKLLIKIRATIYERMMDEARMARKYVQKHGRLDDNFYSELAAFADANHMFSDADMNMAEKSRLPQFNGPEEVQAAGLPSGSRFRDSNGVVRIVP